jgi:hypothetical protein
MDYEVELMTGDLTTVAEHLLDHRELVPGQLCPTCQRTIPKVQSDDNPGRKRQVVSVSVPHGEEGALEELMIQVVDKYKEAWPREYAAMRQQVGLVNVGQRSWKYFVLHFALFAVLNVEGLEPVEEG